MKLSAARPRTPRPPTERRRSKKKGNRESGTIPDSLLPISSWKGVIRIIMATTINKQRLLTHLFTSLKKAYDPGEPVSRPVREQFIYAICRPSATREQADEAFNNLRKPFFDWNEGRVSS